MLLCLGKHILVAEDDKDALDKCKELLSFLPSNNNEKPPIVTTKDDPERIAPELDTIVPENPSRAFDMMKVITSTVDDGYFFELMRDYAHNCIIGFARFNGRPVGIVANRPSWSGGVIDINAADKMARFIRFCDLFNIPLVSFVDCPGYLIGSQQEWNGILRHGAKLLYAWADATVPLISIIIRKSYAGAHYGMLDKVNWCRPRLRLANSTYYHRRSRDCSKCHICQGNKRGCEPRGDEKKTDK